MVFTSKQDCANFLLTKRDQGFISDSTWKKICQFWRDCTSLEEYINLAKRVYVAIAHRNRILPMSYFN